MVADLCVVAGGRQCNRRAKVIDAAKHTPEAGSGLLPHLCGLLRAGRWPMACGSSGPASPQGAARGGTYLTCGATVAGSTDPARPVQSLDQLYSQALTVVTTLHRKASEWAAAAGGRLYDARGTGSDGGEGLHRLEQWIARGLIKPPARALAKAATCYGADPSRLLDVCRARIVVYSPGGAAACIAAILADVPNVQLRRVKNGMRIGCDVEETAGFRVGPLPLGTACCVPLSQEGAQGKYLSAVSNSSFFSFIKSQKVSLGGRMHASVAQGQHRDRAHRIGNGPYVQVSSRGAEGTMGWSTLTRRGTVCGDVCDLRLRDDSDAWNGKPRVRGAGGCLSRTTLNLFPNGRKIFTVPMLMLTKETAFA